MGLDLIDLAMTVESEFGITIPDEDAVNLGTLGSLRDFVIRTLDSRDGAVDRDEVWNRIKLIMKRDHAIADKHLVPGASFVDDFGLDRPARSSRGVNPIRLSALRLTESRAAEDR